jgi:hypothetical protein
VVGDRQIVRIGFFIRNRVVSGSGFGGNLVFVVSHLLLRIAMESS